jgi:parallel beta-helix repeat protein
LNINTKIKKFFLLLLGIIFTFLIINSKITSFDVGDSVVEEKFLKISALSEKIHVDNNWSYTQGNYSWCTGSGTFPDPYVIEDLIIDGEDSGNCILIENSNEYFKIENCTIYNSGDIPYAGIRLSNVNNSQLIDNNCSNNDRGIFLTSCFNNTISGNIANKNDAEGISLKYCDNNDIEGNTMIDNNIHGLMPVPGRGIYLDNSNNNNITGNTADDNGYGIYILIGDNNTVSGNTVIRSNDFGILHDGGYYNDISGNIITYNNKYGIFLQDFFNGTALGNNLNNNEVGITIFWSDNNTVSGNTANYNQYYGILVRHSNYNEITGNTANNNDYGIFLRRSNDNLISDNNFLNNEKCWEEIECNNNIFENNKCFEPPRISGYLIFIILATIFSVTIISGIKLSKTRKR